LHVISSNIAQPPALTSDERWLLYKYDSENGLPQNSVTYIARDNYGMFWIATQDGIARYDGKGLTPYHTSTISDFNQSRIPLFSPSKDSILILKNDMPTPKAGLSLKNGRIFSIRDTTTFSKNIQVNHLGQIIELNNTNNFTFSPIVFYNNSIFVQNNTGSFFYYYNNKTNQLEFYNTANQLLSSLKLGSAYHLFRRTIVRQNTIFIINHQLNYLVIENNKILKTGKVNYPNTLQMKRNQIFYLPYSDKNFLYDGSVISIVR
jgi:hypothetical protein